MKKIKFVFYGVSKVWQTVLEYRRQSGKSKILSVESTIEWKFQISGQGQLSFIGKFGDCSHNQ